MPSIYTWGNREVLKVRMVETLEIVIDKAQLIPTNLDLLFLTLH